MKMSKKHFLWMSVAGLILVLCVMTSLFVYTTNPYPVKVHARDLITDAPTKNQQNYLAETFGIHAPSKVAVQNPNVPTPNFLTGTIGIHVPTTAADQSKKSVASMIKQTIINSTLLFNLNGKCGNVARPVDSTYASTGRFWHLQKAEKVEIFVYSAFYDNRPPVGKQPFIRLLVVATLPVDANVFCYLWFPGKKEPYMTRVSIISSGRGDTVFGVFYGQWLYSCPLPVSNGIPEYVSLSTSACGKSDILVPIYVPTYSSGNVHDFGICVAVSFGELDFAKFSEWIELNHLFGVTEVNIYNASMPAKMDRIFNLYKKRGLLQVHQIPPPVPDYGEKGSSLGSPASLNDCMLRNSMKYKYLVIIDFDEIIVPRKHQNYSSMLQYINHESNIIKPSISYTFRNLYFLKDQEPDNGQPEYLITMRYRNRATPSPFLYGAKSFISPLHCLSVFNHYCWVRFPSSPEPFTIDVSSDIAMSHHYRQCGFGNERCKGLSNGAMLDDFMLQFKPNLDTTVKMTLKEVGYLP